MGMKIRLCFLGLVSVLLLSPNQASGQWSIGSDEDRLRGKAVVDVGAVSEESRTVERYDPLLEQETLETIEWWEFRGRQRYCMESGISLIGFSTAALLLTDDQQGVYLATIESSVGSIEVEVERVFLTECPSY